MRRGRWVRRKAISKKKESRGRVITHLVFGRPDLERGERDGCRSSKNGKEDIRGVAAARAARGRNRTRWQYNCGVRTAINAIGGDADRFERGSEFSRLERFGEGEERTWGGEKGYLYRKEWRGRIRRCCYWRPGSRLIVGCAPRHHVRSSRFTRLLRLCVMRTATEKHKYMCI